MSSIDKGQLPLNTYHIDHVGPTTIISKKYQHLLVIVDAFSKFVWLYPTKTTGTVEAIDELMKQANLFGNLRRIISDRGAAFVSNAIKECCREQNIIHLQITTGLPRGNGQVERVNHTIIPLLSKLAAPTREKWYKYVEVAQKWLNMVPSRSTGKTPFQLLFGVQMRGKDDLNIKELIDEETQRLFNEHRDELRDAAKIQLGKVQAENERNYNKNCKKSHKYVDGDWVAIKRTQFGPGLKLRAKFLGPYEVTRVFQNDCYAVAKVSEHISRQQLQRLLI